MTLKKGIKKLLVANANKKYEKEVKSKNMDYNQWALQQEILQKKNIPLLSANEKYLTIDFQKEEYESKAKSNDRNLAKSTPLCKVICVSEKTNSTSCETQYLVADAKSAPQVEKILKSPDNSIDYVIFKNYPGEISQLAIFDFHQTFQKNENIIVIYSDEDVLNKDGKREKPWFKPDWAPDDFLSFFYFGGLVAFRAEALLTILSDKEESVYDITYRVLKKYNAFDKQSSDSPVYHIPHVLFHTVEACGYEYAKELVQKDTVTEEENAVTKKSKVSVVIPSKDHPDVLLNCIRSLAEKTVLPDSISYDITVVDNGSSKANADRIERELKKFNARYIYEEKQFNFSYMCNLGASNSDGDLILFLNDDMEIVESDWLLKMVKKALLPRAGAVGVKLLYPQSIFESGNVIQHAGITNLRIGPAHKLQFMNDSEDLYFGRNRFCHNMMGVTGACLLVKRQIFNEVGGFDEKLAVAFNDVDLCYKIYEAGYYNIERNDVVVLHHESLSRGNDSESESKQQRLNAEKDYLYEKHTNLYGKDPFYNINLTTDMYETDYSPRFKYEVDLTAPWAKTEDVTDVINISRFDKCVRVGMECAMDIFKWKYGIPKEKSSTQAMPEDMGFYFRGYTFVIGSDNACFEPTLLLKNTDNNRVYSVKVLREVREDIKKNLKDQLNVDLTGYTAKITADALPSGHYRFGMFMKDKTSSLRIYNWSNWTIDI